MGMPSLKDGHLVQFPKVSIFKRELTVLDKKCIIHNVCLSEFWQWENMAHFIYHANLSAMLIADLKKILEKHPCYPHDSHFASEIRTLMVWLFLIYQSNKNLLMNMWVQKKIMEWSVSENHCFKGKPLLVYYYQVDKWSAVLDTTSLFGSITIRYHW